MWRLPLATAGESWRQRYFGSSAATGLAADLADPDLDDIPNLMERALGLNPLVRDWSAALPVVSRDSQNRLSIYAHQGMDALDLIFTAEASADLVTWSAAEATILDNNGSYFSAFDSGPDGPRRFLRLRVTQP